MVVKVADNILSPLGSSVEENFLALLNKQSQLRLYENHWDIPEPFVASLFDETLCQPMTSYTRFETVCIKSATAALKNVDINPASDRVIFILSTTKGNVEHIEQCGTGVFLATSARKIAAHFGNTNQPIVVSNACISGACAQLVAKRCLDSGQYDYAVVIGCDVQSKFIISGFQSFKALSPEQCKPFDKNRIGLNLGEAAATIVFARTDSPKDGQWVLKTGAVRNDANHISGPSRTGEGLYKCLRYVMENGGENGDEGLKPEDIAFINAHGTATLYNDEMEAIAVERAGLSDVTINAYKGYYGHTMGAAGVLESLLSQTAIDHNTIIGTRGYEELGVSRQIKVTAEHASTDKRSFIKMLSGFGGCNIALLYNKI